MELREWDHNAGPSGGFVEVEYPDDIIKDFVNYFRINKQWREDPEIVYRRWLVFERELTDARNARNQAIATQNTENRCTALTKSGDPCQVTNSVEDGLCAIHRRTWLQRLRQRAAVA